MHKNKVEKCQFVLHERLAADSIDIGCFALCRLRLINDAHYPWCILVPRREGVREIYQLSKADRAQLLDESCVLSEVMEALFNPVKMNVAALGNIVPQLHLHHIARTESDPAWPNPIWGAVTAKPYSEAQQRDRVQLIRQALLKTELPFDTDTDTESSSA